MTNFNDMWRGFSVPFVRDGSGDFQTSTDDESVENGILQIVGTQKKTPTRYGELRWNQKFGCNLDELRHKSLHDGVLQELARHGIIESIMRFETRARVTSASVEFEKRLNGEGRIIKPIIRFVVRSKLNRQTESKVSFEY